MGDLSILIPSRNEMFTNETIRDILKHSHADTDIIVVLDGWETDIVQDERVRVIRHKDPIGQRAATNEAARASKAKYLMKCDAHCSFADNFDVIMLENMRVDWTMVPVMRNLHAFDWVCPAGHRRYQSPSGPCKACLNCYPQPCRCKDGNICGLPTTMDIVWIAKNNPQSVAYCFDTEPHFQYFRKFKRRPEARGNITETMSLQGSCFMVTAEKYWELGLCDEEFGSWGSQGIEVAVKTWLSGGTVACNKRTYYAHMFRTQGGDFGFPYKQSWKQVQEAKHKARDVFYDNLWPKQVRPLSWLIEKFKPIPGWHYADKDIKHEPKITEHVMNKGKEFNRVHGINKEKPPTIGLVYYSDGHASPNILNVCQKQIKNCSNGWDIVSVTLVPMSFGRNTVLDKERGYLTMFEQILAGIEQSKADVIFLQEHDVLYHKSHYDFIPPRKDMFYYDENRWFVDANTGHALFYNAMSTSMLVAYREVLLDHYKNRCEKVRKEGFTRRFGFEPGSHKPPRGCDYYERESYFAKFPSIDLRHNMNLTPNRWRKDQFRNQRQLWAWKESDEVEGWGKTKGRMKEFLNAISTD